MPAGRAVAPPLSSSGRSPCNDKVAPATQGVWSHSSGQKQADRGHKISQTIPLLPYQVSHECELDGLKQSESGGFFFFLPFRKTKTLRSESGSRPFKNGVVSTSNTEKTQGQEKTWSQARSPACELSQGWPHVPQAQHLHPESQDSGPLRNNDTPLTAST